MNRLWPWIALTLAIAVVTQFAFVAETPWIVNSLWFRELHAAGVNSDVIYHMGRPKTAGNDVVGYDNPDDLSSFMIYDVSKHPIRIRARVIRKAAAWSICFIDDQTNVFALIRGANAHSDYLNVVLATRRQAVHRRPGERIVYAPTSTGTVLIRTIMPDRYDAAAVARLVRLNAQSTVTVLRSP